MDTMETKIIKLENEIVPIRGCRPTAVSLTIPEKTTYEEWIKIGKVVKVFYGANKWWIGDWLNFGERKYGEEYSQAMEIMQYQYDTLAHYKWVASRIESCRRRQNLSFSHHMEVAKMEPKEQEIWFVRAEEKEWDREEFRKQIKTSNKSIPLPKGSFNIVCADPPWQFDNSGFPQSAESIYLTQKTEEIMNFNLSGNTLNDLKKIVENNSVLFLWATSAMLEDALQVMKGWGFKYKTNMLWIKDRAPGMGWFTQSKHEILLIGVSGQGLHPEYKPDSWLKANVQRHSQKPDEFYKIIEKMYPNSTYLELFGREQRPGWKVWGNEV